MFGLTFKTPAKTNLTSVFVHIGMVALKAGGYTKPFCTCI